jgi:methyltransferase-like protein
VPETGPSELASAATVVFRSGRHHAEVTLPATKAAFALLLEEWPRAIGVDELCTMALERAAPFLPDTPIDDVRRATMADLFWGVMRGMIQLHTVGPACTKRPGDPPRANALAAHQAATSNVVVNARHEMIQLDPVALEVLKLASGERTRAEILEQLLERFASGAITLERAGEAVTAPDAARAILSDKLEATLLSLVRNAVLVG